MEQLAPARWSLLPGTLALILTFVAPARAADAPASSADIARWVRELDDDVFAVRDRATRELQRVGTTAEPALLEALRSGSPEVRRRASHILRDGHWRRLHGDFAEFAALPDERLDVEHGMWLIARILDPSARQRDMQKQLDEIADLVRRRLPADTSARQLEPRRAMELLRDVIFVELKFHGAVRNYQDPANSSLASVLQRKEGLPIVLSHLVISVGTRLGLPLEGVPTPGRYLVKYSGLRAAQGFPKDDVVMDAFDGGKILSKDDLMALFPGLDPDEALEPSLPRQTLVRMLTNLETHLYLAGDTPRAEMVVACRLLVDREEE